MDLILKRTDFRKDGIYGVLLKEDGSILAYTLEHSYRDAFGKYLPKVSDGEYICTRGIHRLAGAESNIETFQIQDVPGHTNILFHIGNFNEDSEGCVLLGEYINKVPMVWSLVYSRFAFSTFMKYELGVDKFNLVVSSV